VPYRHQRIVMGPHVPSLQSIYQGGQWKHAKILAEIWKDAIL